LRKNHRFLRISGGCRALSEDGGNAADQHQGRGHGVRRAHAGKPACAPMTPIFSRIWLVKMQTHLVLLTTAVRRRMACDMSRAWLPIVMSLMGSNSDILLGGSRRDALVGKKVNKSGLVSCAGRVAQSGL
jgi:hypothetical protein